MKIVRAAMIGDVVGEPGLKALEEKLPGIIRENNVDFTVVNGENSADGFGMTESSLKRIIACGADVVTSGNHVWEKREFRNSLETENNILRPANYPSVSPGRGFLNTEKAGVKWIVINMQGREFMTPIDCPFLCFDNIINNLDSLFSRAGDSGLFPVILVDFHAESSREKEALGHYIDGRAAFIAGTHTHVQTADERILPGGTAYITDLGMTGISNSVIGMDVKICLERTRRQVLYRMEPAALPVSLPAADTESNPCSNEIADVEVQGVIVEINAESGKALSVRRI